VGEVCSEGTTARRRKGQGAFVLGSGTRRRGKRGQAGAQEVAESGALLAVQLKDFGFQIQLNGKGGSRTLNMRKTGGKLNQGGGGVGGGGGGGGFLTDPESKKRKEGQTVSPEFDTLQNHSGHHTSGKVDEAGFQGQLPMGFRMGRT